jgi:VWFA-related protein
VRSALRWFAASALVATWLLLAGSATTGRAPLQATPGQAAARSGQSPPPDQTKAQPPDQGRPASQTQPQPPVFRTGAELVRVDVAVLDRKGMPVSSLTAGDFELQEDGVPQEIRTFQFIASTGQASQDDDVSLTIRSRSHAAAEAAKENVRLFLIFWDEYHIGQMTAATRARAYLTQFVRTAFGPTDIVGFMDPLTPIDAIKFTRDRLELAEQVRRLVGRSGVYVPTRSAVEDAHLQRGDVERLRSEVTMSAVKSAAVHMGGMRDGRKSIILISEGLRGIQRDATSMMTDLTRAANDNNTAIYAIDPRGLGQQRFPSLWEGIASDTGGDYFRSNDLDRAFKQVVVESSGYYLLGYSPSDGRLDGRYHRIKVRVKPSGLDVRARLGYWAPSVAEIERARTKAAGAVLPPDVVRALAELPAANARRTIDFWVGTALENNRPSVRLAWVPREAVSAGAPKPAQVTAIATHGDTRVFEGPVDSAGASIAVPPGLLKVTFTVLDATGEVIDRDARTIDVPDPVASPLWVTSPALFRAQNAREFRALDRGPNAMPFPGREFVRTDRLVIRFEVHGTSAAAAKVSARMTSQWGKDLAELPLSPRAASDAPYEIELPLATVARGEFLIAISAAAGADASRVFVPIRVVR